MKRATAILALAALCAATALHANVIRPAPDFTWTGTPGRSSLKSVRGQPVVLIVAPSTRSGAFRSQVKKLRTLYSQFASRGVVFAAAFTEESSPRVSSDIPFAIVENGQAAAAAYDIARGFGIAIIGKDGNVDYITRKVLPASRVRDVIQNSFQIQEQARKIAP